jgi:two-component system, cell cycle response regulator
MTTKGLLLSFQFEPFPRFRSITVILPLDIAIDLETNPNLINHLPRWTSFGVDAHVPLFSAGAWMRILIADDEVVSRKLLQKTLESAGYEVTAVENGRLAADQLFPADGPRLALLDWVMPGLDGPGVCREVRKRKERSYIYMVLLTSKESKEDVVAGLESGADDFLTKPFDPEELKARLRTGLRILHLEDRLVEAREKMRFQATHDGLTGLWNRGVIVDLLGRELARSSREQICTVILMCDLDHFKSVNDTYGHLAGDEVLKETAKRLLASVRSYDFVGRYGGEEFLVVLNNCNPAFAFARAEEIRKAIAQKPVPSSSGPLPITMSLGLLLSQEWGRRPVEELLHEADAALYAAKAAGRNSVKIAHPKISAADSDSQVHDPVRLRR